MLLSQKKRHSVFYNPTPSSHPGNGDLFPHHNNGNGNGAAAAEAETRKPKYLLAQQLETINSLIKEVALYEHKAAAEEEENKMLREQVRELRDLYFSSLGRGIKLQGVQLGWPMVSMDSIDDMYAIATEQNIPYREWPNWLTLQLEPPSERPSAQQPHHIIGEPSHLIVTPSSYNNAEDNTTDDLTSIDDGDEADESEAGSDEDVCQQTIPWAEYISHEDFMVLSSYFSWREMNLLIGSLNSGAPSLSRENIMSLFSDTTPSPLSLLAQETSVPCPLSPTDRRAHFTNQQGVESPVVDLFMNALDRRHTGSVTTQQFIHALSIISRGTVEEKAALVFAMCDVNGDGLVCKEDLLCLVREVHAVLPSYAFMSDSADAVASEIFTTGSSDQALDIKAFAVYARELPDVSRGFGLFDHVFYTIVRPVIEAASRFNTESPEYSLGILLIRRSIGGIFSGPLVPRWFEIRDGFLIGYKALKRDTPSEVLCLLHASVRAVPNTSARGLGKKQHTTFVLNVPGVQSREFTAHTARQASEWVNAIRANAIGGYRYHSFAPVRPTIGCKWYVNAVNYFNDLEDVLGMAQQEIFIAGWWVTPMVYLRRKGMPLDESHRLDNVLLERAKAGINVYILVWEETSFSLQLGSKFTKDYLEGLHPNIHVLRHPRFTPLMWSNHQKSVIIDQSLAFLGGIDLCYGRYDDEKFSLVDLDESMYPGLDYGNVCLGFPCKNDGAYDACLLDRTKQARMPWHDIQVRVDGEAARDASFNFIQRWNHARNDYPAYPLIVPAIGPLPPVMPPDYDSQTNCECQIVRSVSEWSAGQPVEDSFYQAYMDIIANSKHYIFIQNQYFISSVGDSQPKNKIASALVNRIRQAISENSVFRVIILLPIHSEGALVDKTTCILVLWTMRTIHAMMKALKDEFPHANLDDYITFSSLRNWGVAGTHIFTEQVYVHSKLMIVDDRIAIIGSANINDRSLRGSRDSEIGSVIRDTEFVDSTMNGQPYKAGVFAHTLRMKLWKVHLGLHHVHEEEQGKCNITHNTQGNADCSARSEDSSHYSDIRDPVTATSYHHVWRGQAKTNTDIYKEIFAHRIPENCSKLSQLRRGSILPVAGALREAAEGRRESMVEVVERPGPGLGPHDAVVEVEDEPEGTSIDLSTTTLVGDGTPGDHDIEAESVESITGRDKKDKINPRMGRVSRRKTYTDRLEKIRGYLVEYPVSMLSDEELGPAVLTKEWFLDQKVFL
eukprot:TRINITY_DN8_c1_g1_i6.p1 TRINITY_DN8_c1_g1~~TRINITY_DN8_c1_g1_i6.p1  ORF type:complete len:1235 (+),score=360.26 TRINITY_DN8_c1_g1_i6:102-3806(+)